MAEMPEVEVTVTFDAETEAKLADLHSLAAATRRANALANTLQTVKDENTALLAENARLRRELERRR